MDYGQTSSTNLPGKNPMPGVTVDKVCKLLRSGQPIVWSVAIVFGLLGVSWIVDHFWRKKRVPNDDHSLPDGNIWTRT
jgi:hypothetical protein